MKGKNGNIVYTSLEAKDIDVIAPLWRKLNEHHKARSPGFQKHYELMKWDMRKRDLLEKSRGGFILVDVAKNADTNKAAGYCVSTVSGKRHGEIDSIFIEEKYRRCGIGDNFIKRALDWMAGHSASQLKVEVAAGNEEVLPFYSRYNFFPRSLILRQKE